VNVSAKRRDSDYVKSGLERLERGAQANPLAKHRPQNPGAALDLG
jgi:hypothetical protein